MKKEWLLVISSANPRSCWRNIRVVKGTEEDARETGRSWAEAKQEGASPGCTGYEDIEVELFELGKIDVFTVPLVRRPRDEARVRESTKTAYTPAHW